MGDITCTITDDSTLFRKLIADICYDIGFNILKEFSTGENLLQAISKNEIEEPDVIFLDINMPGRSGKDILENLLDLSPDSIIIMVSTASNSRVVKECLELGASNFIDKSSDSDLIKKIIFSTLKTNGIKL